MFKLPQRNTLRRVRLTKFSVTVAPKAVDFQVGVQLSQLRLMTNRTWITADEHFDHKKISEYTGRPFKTVDEMNETIITNHNAVVAPEDTIYILGDFALTKKKKMAYFVSRLNGYKILLVGNHDRHFLQRECKTQDIKRFLDFGFNEVYSGIIVRDNFILSHVPMYIDGIPMLNVGVDAWNWTPIPFPSIKQQINLCAHIHEKWIVDTKI